MTTTQPLDPDLFAAARKALDDDPRIPQDVRVHVDGGSVTLTGTVRLSQEKSVAEAIVRQIDGVRTVVNHLNVAKVVSPENFEPPDCR